MLQKTFRSVLQKYTGSELLIPAFWSELESHYREPHRHYHTLAHLTFMFSELHDVVHLIEEYDTVLLALFYHDSIYDSTSSENEQRSADLMKHHMEQTSFSRIDCCSDMILATTTHKKSENNDINIFLDIDLSILGKEWGEYQKYAENVRKEYIHLSDGVYQRERVKVLSRFLKYTSIFITEYFSEKYETAARKNIQREIEEYRL